MHYSRRKYQPYAIKAYGVLIALLLCADHGHLGESVCHKDPKIPLLRLQTTTISYTSTRRKAQGHTSTFFNRLGFLATAPTLQFCSAPHLNSVDYYRTRSPSESRVSIQSQHRGAIRQFH